MPKTQKPQKYITDNPDNYYPAVSPEDYREDELLGPLDRVLIDLDELNDTRPLSPDEARLYFALERYLFPENEAFKPENLADTEAAYMRRTEQLSANMRRKLSARQQGRNGYVRRKADLIRGNRKVTGQTLSSDEADELMAEIYSAEEIHAMHAVDNL